jgi:hypothetical protein
MRKKMIRKISQGLIFSLVAILLLGASSAKASFGITPPYVSNDKLTQGSSFEQSVLLIRDDPVTSVKVTAAINVPGADNWISIDKGLSFSLPKGEKITPIVVTINVPNDASFKEYQGKIDIKTEPNALTQGEVSIGLGGQIKVDFTVVNEKINSFTVDSIRASDSKEGDNIKIIANINNKGNIATAPTKAVLDIYGNDGKSIIATKDNINSIEKVKQFASGDVILEFSGSDIKMGNYLGKVKVYNNSEVVFEGEVNLSVLQKSKSAMAGESSEWANKLLASIGLDTLNPMIAYAVVIVVLLVILILIIRSVRKKSKKEKRKLSK